MTGFPILYRKRKFIGILPEISGFYNFDEVFAHFKAVLQVKNLTYYFMRLRYPI